MRHVAPSELNIVHLVIVAGMPMIDATPTTRAVRQAMREERTKLTRKARRARIAEKEAFLRGMR
ncbi:hypothetical protein [Methylobacterium sp. E-045]|uniref:hypothetical protein n=1 Tax=Methylobacterium sp. E-045 TaxID=2836575 RepID=UPI001FB8C0DC|nr:hypothetical protein [Methylobacterium sp. E-045]MCJ2131590.1 hypothetical protein [Methylobacterium sp. E-045]